MVHNMHTPRYLSVLITVSLSLTMLAAVPAGADEADNRFGDTYNSISEAMISYYAASSGQTLSAFLAANAPQVAAGLFGNAELSGALASVASVDDLRRVATQQSVVFDLSAATSFDDLYAEFLAKSSTLDGQVALVGASYATQLSTLQIPDLESPTLPQLDGAVPAEALTFGLFYDQSVANLISDHPDVFGAVAATGLGTPAATDAWKQSMLAAGVQTRNLTDRLPSPCIADLVGAMSTGVAQSANSSCEPCATAGSYLHQVAGRLLDPTTNTVIPSEVDGTADTRGWLNSQLAAQNPSLEQQLDATVNPNSAIGGCFSSRQASTVLLGQLLPDVFSTLADVEPADGPQLPGPFGNLLGADGPQSSQPNSDLPGPFGNLSSDDRP